MTILEWIVIALIALVILGIVCVLYSYYRVRGVMESHLSWLVFLSDQKWTTGNQLLQIVGAQKRLGRFALQLVFYDDLEALESVGLIESRKHTDIRSETYPDALKQTEYRRLLKDDD